MSFLAVLFALMLEQARPLARDNAVHALARQWVSWVRQSLDAGRGSHGVLVWSVAVLAPALGVAGVHWLLWSYSLLLTFAWAVVVLYVTLGFRSFSHHFTAIRTALEQGDEDEAARELARWRQEPTPARLGRSGVLALVMSHAVLAVHRHVLGVLVAFVLTWWLGLGPAGAVLFRLADHLARVCRKDEACVAALAAPSAADGSLRSRVAPVAAQAWRWINYLPSRCTAVAFAVVGNFEEAVAAWRARMQAPGADDDAIVLAAASGALNVQMGAEPLADGSELREPTVGHLASVVGLVWRSVVLWMLLLALLTLANVMG